MNGTLPDLGFLLSRTRIITGKFIRPRGMRKECEVEDSGEIPRAVSLAADF